MRTSFAALAVLAVLAGIAGCQAEVPGHAGPAEDGRVVKDGTQLRFRPVLAEVPALSAEPAAGAAPERQSLDPAAQQAAARALDCTADEPDPLGGRDDPARPLVTCDRTLGTRYVLGPAFLSGTDVGWVVVRSGAGSERSVVAIRFTATGAQTWAGWTGGNVGKRVAVVLRGRVLTAPTVQSAITGGETEISGPYTPLEARQLARDIAGG